MSLVACGGADTEAASPPPAAPVPTARPGTRLAQPRICMEVDPSGELAREGNTLRLRFDSCWCGEELTCSARADDGAIDLELHLRTPNGLCDACLEGLATCTIPPMRRGTMRILNDGRMLGEVRVSAREATAARTETCVPAEAPVTLIQVPN
jgi:hypothetical protein